MKIVLDRRTIGCPQKCPKVGKLLDNLMALDENGETAVGRCPLCLAIMCFIGT